MAASETARLTRAPLAARLRGIYAIVNAGGDPLAIARAALDGGVRVVQYRAKHGINAAHARELRRLTRERDALLIFNDDVDAVLAFEGDGVHLGPGDRGFADVPGVRAALGDRLIGLSCGTPKEARAAQAGGADYAGVGSVFATRSKDDAGEPIGLSGLRTVASTTHLPIAAIGGISLATVAAVARTGVAMAAVISAIAGAPDPAQAAAELARRWAAAEPPRR